MDHTHTVSVEGIVQSIIETTKSSQECRKGSEAVTGLTKTGITLTLKYVISNINTKMNKSSNRCELEEAVLLLRSIEGSAADATYKLNNLRMPLYIFLVINGYWPGRKSCYFFLLSNERISKNAQHLRLNFPMSPYYYVCFIH